MKRCGRGVKMVGLLISLTPETHWLSVGMCSILRLDNILIFCSLINYFSNEI